VSTAPPDLPGRLEDLAHRLEQATGPVLLVADDLQVHPDALADLTHDPRGATAALVSRQGGECDVRADAVATVRLRGGRVVAAASSVHRVSAPDAASTGALQVAGADRAAAAEAARAAAAVARTSGWSGDPVDHLLVALVRRGTVVGSVSLDPWPWRRGAAGQDRSDFQRRLDGIDPATARSTRLARAMKADDGLVATVVSRPVSRRLTPLALRWRLTPNQVTVGSFLLGLAAAGCFATGNHILLVVGALLLQLSLAVDCVDGDVARYCRSFSASGAWLDASTDRVKEFACYGGLAWGADAGATGWLLAAAMLTLQTARHSVDYTFTAVKDLRESAWRPVPLGQADDGMVEPDSVSARAVRASERSNRAPAVKWAKRALHMGIGERWMVLSVFAALGRPVVALGALLGLGLVSFAYTAAGRTLRSRAWRRSGDPSAREREIVAAQADLGPLLPPSAAALVAAGAGAFLWLRPALLRVVEYALVVVLVWLADPGALPAAFLLLLVVASHHYDDLYRVLNRLSPAVGWARVLGLGVPGRLLVVAVLAALGGQVLEGGLWVLAAGLGILYLVAEPVRVLREVRSVPPGDAVPAGALGG
jgi:hypothetical protein